jgi:hypothetical protein
VAVNPSNHIERLRGKDVRTTGHEQQKQGPPKQTGVAYGPGSTDASGLSIQSKNRQSRATCGVRAAHQAHAMVVRGAHPTTNQHRAGSVVAVGGVHGL